MKNTHPNGWCKPQPKKTVAELESLIAEKRTELSALQVELHNLVEGPRLEALAQIRNIMRAQQLTLAEVCGA